MKFRSGREKQRAGITGSLIGRSGCRLPTSENTVKSSLVFSTGFSSRFSLPGFLLLRLSLLPPAHRPSMASTNQANTSSSGITVNAETGERYIPSSTRADGSKRREIRVRPGYRPPEDVELYRNRAAEAWKNRGKGAVPGAESVSKDNDQTTKSATPASNKNAKRREAKKKAKAEGAEGKDVTAIDNWRAGADKKKPEEQKPAEGPAPDAEAENEKKARNLKKKLRQARELREKRTQGESLLPEQLEKVIKIQELVRQLDALGFDSNGEKKGATGGEREGVEGKDA